MASLIVTSGKEQGKTLVIDRQERVVIGRDPDCDLHLDHPDVSRRHAELVVTPQGLLLRDLGSTNQTLVEGQAVKERLLQHGQEITFGTVTARVELDPAQATRVAATRVRPPAASLVDADGRAWPLSQETTLVGREKTCDLVLAAESVSARHAELKLTPQGLMVKDLGSTNGTFVNGEKISEKLVKDGDELAFDVVKYQVKLAGGPAGTVVRQPAAAPPAAASGGSRSALWIVVAVLVVAGAALAWWLASRPAGKPAPMVASTTVVPTTAAPATTSQAVTPPAPAAETAAPARQVIDRLVFNHVWSYTTKDQVFSSPAVGDINGDKVLDVVVGSNDGNLYAVDGETGRLLWLFKTGVPVMSSPLLTDLTGDQVPDVVFGGDTGQVYVLDGKGRKVWAGPDGITQGQGNEFQSSPAVADLNGDGLLDVVVGNLNCRVYALTGDRGWALWDSGTIINAGVLATPALADINGDNRPEVFVGSLNNRFYCLDGAKGWLVWEFAASKNQIKASAAVGDLDGDGKPEVVVPSTDGTLYALHATDGLEMWRLERGQAMESSPALADVNGDGKLDVLVATMDCKLLAVNGVNGLVIWEFDMKGAPAVSSPAIFDLNGDGTDDIIQADAKGVVHAVSGKTGWELANFQLNAPAFSSPALADINGDGLLDVALGSQDGNLVVLTLNVPVPKGKVVWENFRLNHRRTGG